MGALHCQGSECTGQGIALIEAIVLLAEGVGCDRVGYFQECDRVILLVPTALKSASTMQPPRW